MNLFLDPIIFPGFLGHLAALMTEYVLNQYQLADALGKSQAAVSKTITLNKLTEDIRDACRSKIEEIYNALNPQPAPEEPVNPSGPSTNLA